MPPAKKTAPAKPARTAAAKKTPAKRPQKRLPRKGQPGIPPPKPDELAELRIRQARAVELALSGMDYQQIADELEYADKSGAWRAVRAALDRNEQPKVKEYRDLENARLDRLQLRLWPIALGEDDDLALRATDRLLRLFERRAKLNGLDQQAARDAGAFAEALLGDPKAREQRLTALRDELAAKRAEKEAAEDTG